MDLSSVSTTVVAVVGIAATWHAGKRSGDQTLALARETRKQERLAEAHIALLEMSESVGAWAQSVKPFLDTIPPQPVPPLPPVEVQTKVGARVEAFGSAPVRGANEEWLSAVRAVLVSVQLLEFPEHDVEPLKRLIERRPLERTLRAALAEAVRAESGAP